LVTITIKTLITKGIMKKLIKLALLLSIIITPLFSTNAQKAEKTVPIFENGEAQIVTAFEDSEKWIRHDLWVETGFDTDGDGKLDRMHVAVTRPPQTDSEGLKLPNVGGIEAFNNAVKEK
jgi:X-Pro dipeptidyl-peptidase